MGIQKNVMINARVVLRLLGMAFPESLIAGEIKETTAKDVSNFVLA